MDKITSRIYLGGFIVAILFAHFLSGSYQASDIAQDKVDKEMSSKAIYHRKQSQPVESLVDELMSEVYVPVRDYSREMSYSRLDLRTGSDLTVQQLNEMLLGTNLAGMGMYFHEAENNWNVNALFLIALAGEESGYGSSHLSKEKNNIFGFHAFDDNPEAATSYSSVSECINDVAAYLSVEYLSSRGQYYMGDTVGDVNHYYCTNKEWANEIVTIMNELTSKLNR
jgi:beta-N-acetylglucosaminidase